MHRALSSSLQIEKAMQACIQAAPVDFPADGIFINYYREDIHSIQFIALATKKYCRLKPSIISIPEHIASNYKVGENFTAVVLNNLADDPLTQFVIKSNFRKIKSVVVMRLKMDETRLGAAIFFSYKKNAFNHEHAEIIESLRGIFSLLTARTLYQLKLIRQHRLNMPYAHHSSRDNKLPDGFIVSQTSPLYPLINRLPALAKSERPIVIQGEQGTGKSQLSQYLHILIDKKERPAAILHSQTLTLAINQNDKTIASYKLTDNSLLAKTIFDYVNDDLLFIENIEYLSHAVRQQILNQYQIQKEAGKKITLIVSQTLPPSVQLTEDALFISESYYSVFSFKLHLLPLRRRRCDIPELVTYYLAKISARYQQPLPILSTRFQRYLQTYDWPGNISELIACLEKAFIISNNGILDIYPHESVFDSPQMPTAQLTLDDVIKQHIIRVLRETNGKISGKGGAAEKLNINSNTLYSKMKKLNITKNDFMV